MWSRKCRPVRRSKLTLGHPASTEVVIGEILGPIMPSIKKL
ncbi:hypothetical protein TNCT_98741, partial [Trichonephila clavata]